MLRISFIAGVIGAVLMSVVLFAGRAVGESVLSLEYSLGKMLTGSQASWSWGSWWLGLLAHMLIGGMLGLLYGTLFRLTGVSGKWFGASLGLAQWIVVGLIMGFTPFGFFAADYGWFSVVELLFVHVLYGATLGGIFSYAERAGWIQFPEDAPSATSPLADSLGQGLIDFEEYKKNVRSR